MSNPELEQEVRSRSAAVFSRRCRDEAGDLHCVVHTNNDRGPFVAEWTLGAGVFVGGFRVRLICWQFASALRVFTGTLVPETAAHLAMALGVAADIGASFKRQNCGGTHADVEAAHRNEEPLQ